ncbi:MAG: hypothetical protein RID09_21410 [Coleofasciculus sp. G1-WW12-02]|uniref:hypothetical protein n=1 Tax=Coleofasciculus sp. G1-WW12-02 TaxID=3068483 RepID=UPI0032F753C6
MPRIESNLLIRWGLYSFNRKFNLLAFCASNDLPGVDGNTKHHESAIAPLVDPIEP